MKKRFYQLGKKVAILSAVAICALLTANQTFAQGVSINATGTGTAPDGSAILDLNIVTKGFLVPRMTQAQRNSIGLPATSLLIYQTDNTPGFYYNSGTPGVPVWTTFGGGSGPTAGNDIDVTGTQVDVEPILDFVHTINGVAGTPLTLNASFLNALVFSYNGTEGARLSSSGNFGVGDATPASLFTVGNGDLFQVNASGNLIAINGLTGYSWPAAHASGVLRNNGTGTLTWGAPTITGVAPLTNGTIWIGNASSIATEQTMSGDVTMTNAGVTTIQDNAVDGTDISISGESATNTALQYNNGTGNWEAVAPATTVTSFSAINTGLTPNSATTGAVVLAGTLDVDNGGTGATTLTGMLKGNGTAAVTGVTGTQWGATYWSDANTIAATAAGTTGQLLRATTGGAPTWSNDIPASDADYIQNQNTAAQATSNFWISGRGTFGSAGARFLESVGGTFYTTLLAGDQAADLTLTLPINAGSANQVLQTNGAGTLSWATPFTNPMNSIGDMIYGGASGVPTELPSGNGLLLGNGGAIPTWLNGSANYTLYHNGTAWVTNSSATTGLLTNGTTVGIGVAPGTPKLDVIGDQNVGTIALQLRAGNATGAPEDAVQIAFGYSGTDTYRHNIRSVHNTGDNMNKLMFYVWQPSQLTSAMGNKKVIEIDYEKFAFYGTLAPQNNPGALGQILVSGGATPGLAGWLAQGAAGTVLQSNGAGFAPTWVAASTGTVTGVTATDPIFVTVSSPNPVISIKGTAGGVLYGTGAGTTALFSAVGTAGQILRSNAGAAPTWQDVAAMNLDLTVQNGLYLSTGTTYDGSVATTIKQGGALTEATTITQANFDMTHSLSGTGDFVVQTTATNKFIFDAATGNVGIGNITSPTHKLQIDGKVKSTGINETSDIRLKTNFSNIDGALNKVLSMNGKYYDWRTSEFPNKGLEKGRQVGVIAQEIEKILPEVVDTDNEGFKSVEYSHIVPVLIEAIKEQQKIIDGQKSTINDLKASLENVLNRVNIIEKNVDLNSSKVEK